MTYTLNQIFTDTYPPEAAQFCNANGYVIKEIEKQNGKRRFQIQEIPAPTPEEIAEREAQEAARIAEAQRVPDLEDATIDLASYIAELEERIITLETAKEA